jgi:ABC-type sugar transport system substrate-binding protein
MKSKIAKALVLLAVLLFTAGVVFAAGTKETTKKEVVVALCQANLESAFPQAERMGAIEKAKEYGYTVLNLVADGDAQKQASQIEDAISKKVAAVICWPVDTKAIVASVSACKEAKIPYIALSRMPGDLSKITAAAVVDNFGAATMMTASINEYKTKKGWSSIKVIELVGDLADQNAKERTQGYQDEAKRLGFNTVSQIPTEWNPQKAFDGLVAALRANPSAQAIYIPSDFLWPAVQSALKTAGMLYSNKDNPAKHIYAVAMDGDPNGLQALRDGYLDFNLNQDPIMLGKLAVELAQKAITKQKIPNTMVPVENVPITVANADNPGYWGNVFKK